MKKERFGTLPDGEAVTAYTLQNENALLRVMTRGATILNFRVFGRDIVGGFDTLEDYLADTSHQGALIGRVANRIAGAAFTMDGKEYRLPKNNGENCLHGGDGFDHRNFEVLEADERHLRLTYHSPDGEEGFPSALDVTVEYRLDGTSLLIDYTAVPHGRTPIALTNHSYFNLDGFGTTIEHHVATIYADRYTEVGEDLIPNGYRLRFSRAARDRREDRRRLYRVRPQLYSLSCQERDALRQDTASRRYRMRQGFMPFGLYRSAGSAILYRKFSERKNRFPRRGKTTAARRVLSGNADRAGLYSSRHRFLR